MSVAQSTQSLPASSPISLPIPVLVLVFGLLWSSAFSVAKLAMADCPPLLLLALRFLVAGIIILGVATLRGTSLRIGRRDLLVFAALGVVNQAVYLGIGYVGMQSVSSGLAALIISANPVLTAVLAAVFLDEPMTWRKTSGLILGLAGVAFIVESRLAGGTEHLSGIALTLVALVSLVTGTILFKRLAPRGDLWVGNGVQSLAAGIALAPVAFTLEGISEIRPSWRLLAAFAYLALLVSIVAFLIWFQLLAAVGATAASAYHFLMPPLGILFGWLLLGEHVELFDLIGVVPVALGIYLVTRPARAPPGATTRP
jgi:drug/metabolite transporter (DMT)-like permease